MPLIDPSRLKYHPPKVDRILRIGTYYLASVGLILLAFNHVLFDRWAVFGGGIATMFVLTVILFTAYVELWLLVTAAWIYAIVIELIRAPAGVGKWGLALVFLALAFGSASTYTAWRQGRYTDE